MVRAGKAAGVPDCAGGHRARDPGPDAAAGPGPLVEPPVLFNQQGNRPGKCQPIVRVMPGRPTLKAACG